MLVLIRERTSLNRALISRLPKIKLVCQTELIAPNALEQALKAGRPEAAAVDVYESEPVLPTLALLHLENVLATPHIGFVEQDSYERYFRPAFEAIQHFVHGLPVKNIATKA